MNMAPSSVKGNPPLGGPKTTPWTLFPMMSVFDPRDDVFQSPYTANGSSRVVLLVPNSFIEGNLPSKREGEPPPPMEKRSPSPNKHHPVLKPTEKIFKISCQFFLGL